MPPPATRRKLSGVGEREGRGPCRDPHGQSEGHEGRAIVYEALAADDRADALGHAEPAEDRLGRHGVRRREDSPEHERQRPRQPDHEVGRRGDHEDRREHEAYGQQRDRPQVRAQVERRGEETSRVQERRQEDHEDHLGRYLHRRQPRREAEREPAEHQEDRVRNPNHAGQLRQQRRRPEQED